MSGMNALDVYQEKIPQTKVIMFTVLEDDVYVIESIRRGAKGYFAKSSHHLRILDTIEDAMNGFMPIDSHVAEKVLKYLHQTPSLEGEFGLTKRETENLKFLSTGKKRHTLAGELFISDTTLKTHLHNIYSKLQVHNRTEAIMLAMKKHII